MWRRYRTIPLIVALGVLPRVVHTQQITRDNYFVMLPPTPRIVGQTQASAAIKLFGDRSSPAFRDADPADGIDDARGARLMQLAERFSPIIRPNNISVPRDPFDVIGQHAALHIDRWENAERVASDSLILSSSHLVAQAGAPNTQHPSPSTDISPLRRLYARHAPTAPRSPIATPELDAAEILFFDLPGDEPRSWIRHARTLASTPSKIFAHPFIHEDRNAAGAARYLLVMQYWFFFSFNNSANNHEGDWEHINVQITMRARERRRAGLMTRGEIVRLLDHAFSADSTIIAAVEYHFHHWVMTLDYLERRVQPNERDSTHRHDQPSVWKDRDHIRRAIDRRLTAANGRLATHPFVFLGGNHKGPAEMLEIFPRFTWSLRRNSDGAYPFPGTWQTVGPFGVTEQMHGHIVPPLRGDTATPWDSLVADPDYLTYTARNIVLIPDWEMLEPLLATSDDALARWGWMVMPIHFGFPASRSIGAGAMKHVDMGNVAPHAPTFKAQWNRVGLSADRQRYDPIVLRTPVSPTTPWALVRNGWGILNVPFGVWGLMPGYNVVMHELMPWAGGTMHTLGLPPPRTFTAARLPHRFTSEGQGAFWEFGGTDLARLLPTDSGANPSMTRVANPGVRFWAELFFHDRFALENSYSLQTSTISRGNVTAKLQQRQLTGGVRFTPRALAGYDHSLRVFARAGYGWLALKAYDVVEADTAIGEAREGRLPSILPNQSWWPNTWYAGGGVELFAPPRAWLFHRLGYGLRVESSAYYHRLPINDGVDEGRTGITRQDLAVSLVFGW
jgi:hypothetical protein